MGHRWINAFLVPMVILAGCTSGVSQDGISGSAHDSQDYPPGWSDTGVSNLSTVQVKADQLVRTSDFKETRVSITHTGDAKEQYVISVARLTIDWGEKRFFYGEYTYKVSEEVARQIRNNGIDNVIRNNGIDNVNQSQLSSTNIVYASSEQYHTYSNSSGTSASVESYSNRSFGTSVEQRLPLLYQLAILYLDQSKLSDGKSSNAAFTYQISGMYSNQWNKVEGHYIVSEAGVISNVEIDGHRSGGIGYFTYNLELEDQRVEEPDWIPK